MPPVVTVVTATVHRQRPARLGVADRLMGSGHGADTEVRGDAGHGGDEDGGEDHGQRESHAVRLPRRASQMRIRVTDTTPVGLGSPVPQLSYGA